MDYIFIYSINMLCTVDIKLLYFKILLIHGNEEINYVEQFNCCCISFRIQVLLYFWFLLFTTCSIFNPELPQSNFLKMYKFHIKKNVSLHNIGISNVANIHWSLPIFESKFLYLYTSNSIWTVRQIYFIWSTSYFVVIGGTSPYCNPIG